jgi:hypothetical protein
MDLRNESMFLQISYLIPASIIHLQNQKITFLENFLITTKNGKDCTVAGLVSAKWDNTSLLRFQILNTGNLSPWK